MKNTNRNTTVKDAAKFFWGKKEFETALKTDRKIKATFDILGG